MVSRYEWINERRASCAAPARQCGRADNAKIRVHFLNLPLNPGTSVLCVARKISGERFGFRPNMRHARCLTNVSIQRRHYETMACARPRLRSALLSQIALRRRSSWASAGHHRRQRRFRRPAQERRRAGGEDINAAGGILGQKIQVLVGAIAPIRRKAYRLPTNSSATG